MYPYYVIRALGGVLYLTGALIMVYNLWMTCTREEGAETAPAVTPASAMPAPAE